MKTRTLLGIIGISALIPCAAFFWLVVIGIVTSLSSKDQASLPPVTTAVVPSGPKVTAPTIQDPDLVAKAMAMKMDISEINLSYDPALSKSNRSAEYSKYGVNEVTYTLTVRPNQTRNKTYIGLAHEYYHYIWDKYPETKDLSPALLAMYTAYEPLNNRMQVYIDTGMSVDSEQFSNELWAIICTEVTPERVSPQIMGQCNRWVDRSMTTALY